MKKIIQTKNAPQAIGAYSQAIQVNNTVYVSGQIPLTATSSELISLDFKEQAIQVFQNLSEIAKAAGGSLKNFVKLNVYLTDLKNFPTLNEIMKEFIEEPYPARAAVEVSALPKNASIEIEGIMFLE